jgi:hypothetical protein
MYPLVFGVGVAALLWLSRNPLSAPDLGDRKDPDSLNTLWWTVLVGVASWTLWTLRSSWAEGSAWVDLDPDGLRWQEGGETHRVLWDGVSGLESEGAEHPVLALTLKQGGRAALPFATRDLYRALRQKLGPIPPSEEKRMGLG